MSRPVSSSTLVSSRAYHDGIRGKGDLLPQHYYAVLPVIKYIPYILTVCLWPDYVTDTIAVVWMDIH